MVRSITWNHLHGLIVFKHLLPFFKHFGVEWFGILLVTLNYHLKSKRFKNVKYVKDDFDDHIFITNPVINKTRVENLGRVKNYQLI